MSDEKFNLFVPTSHDEVSKFLACASSFCFETDVRLFFDAAIGSLWSEEDAGNFCEDYEALIMLIGYGAPGDRFERLTEAAKLAFLYEQMFLRYPSISASFGDLFTRMVDDASAVKAKAEWEAFLDSCRQAINKGKRYRKKKSTYFLHNPVTGLIKIGRSQAVRERVKSLETGSGVLLDILAVIDEDMEYELHRRFSHLRVQGEWFKDKNKEIATFVSGL